MATNNNDRDIVQKADEKYAEERDKRLRDDGLSQFVALVQHEIEGNTTLKRFHEDPWVDDAEKYFQSPFLSDGSQCKVLVVGAGFSGMLFAIHLLKNGAFRPEDIRIIDVAGGFGGTWYWNRYPGIMCDVESSVYIPMLEEMGYMPRNRYAYGHELRDYCESLADKWELKKITQFRALGKHMTWDDGAKRWNVQILRKHAGSDGASVGDDDEFTVNAQFVYLAAGVLIAPHLPNISGLGQYKGHSFHTSRWDYAYTGGTPANPEMVNLADKSVAIIGTGATAVQAIPHLAKHSKHLYVFQRTPSAVDYRENPRTDAEWWQKQVAGKGKGWQRERIDNFQEFVTNVDNKPAVNMVDDAWTKMPGYCALTGRAYPVTDVDAHIAGLRAADYVRQEQVRNHADSVVHDKAVAEKLKAYYYTWCKRPCFHDEYLQSFNRPNVTLIDTNGKGVDNIAQNGIEFDGKTYNVDVIIFSTGFTLDVASPAITGKNGLTMHEKWADGIGTLHGVMSHGFPNLCFAGLSQAAFSAAYSFMLDTFATHSAYVISEGYKKSTNKDRVEIEPTAEAENTWVDLSVQYAVGLAATGGCTPGYFNKEGELDKMDKLKVAKTIFWGYGPIDYVNRLTSWRNQGGLDGVAVSF